MYHLHGSAKPGDKLSPFSQKGYLIGYNGHNIYRIWDPEKDVILTTSDLDILEDFGTIGTTPTSETASKGDKDLPTRQKPIRPFVAVNPISEVIAAQATQVKDLEELNLDEYNPDIQWIRPAKDFKVCFATIDTSGLNANLPTTLKQALSSPEGQQ
jgi:hypothetical protein